MGMVAGLIRPVDAASLEDYPIGRDERLPELSFVKWMPSRWLNSSGHLKCDYEVQGVARALFDIATAQSPIGTLPNDDEELAALLRLPLQHWLRLRSLGERGPLRNWVACRCPGSRDGGEVRLMHHVVLATLEDVLARREHRETVRGQQADRKRHDRLRSGMMAAGMGATECDDPVLMRRIDDWLFTICTGNRLSRHYQSAYEYAVRQQWVSSGVTRA